MGKKILFVTLLVVFIAAVITIFLLPKTVKTPIQTSLSIPTQIPEKLCNSFPPNPGETSCQDAVNLALAKYPGKITKIDKKIVQASTEVGQGTKPSNIDPSTYKPPQHTFDNKAAWVISITANQEFSFPTGTTKFFDIAVGVKEKKILVVYPKF